MSLKSPPNDSFKRYQRHGSVIFFFFFQGQRNAYGSANSLARGIYSRRAHRVTVTGNPFRGKRKEKFSVRHWCIQLTIYYDVRFRTSALSSQGSTAIVQQSTLRHNHPVSIDRHSI